MRNQPLGLVRSKVKAETGKSLDSNSTAQDAEINQLIENVQASLATDYDWPFLKSRWDSILTPGPRFQDFPTTLSPQGGSATAAATINFERPARMEIKWNNIWQPVIYGIDEYPEFNYLDSDRGQVLDPVQRWQFSDQGQFEVWPLPASTTQVRFIQQRQPVTLQTGAAVPPVWNDLALLDLDDLLVTYFVAANYLLREEKPNAQAVLGQANRRLMALLGAYPNRTEPIIVGRGQTMGRKAIRQVPMVLVAGNTK